MKKEIKYTIIALFAGAALMFAIFFIVGDKKKEYTVVFDSNGGGSVSSQVIIEGNKITKPENPQKENYNFIRWEYENKEYDFNSEVSCDMTLKAIWEEVKPEAKYYDIEFSFNGVTKTLSLSVITENDLESLGFEEKEGYEIKWYVNDEEYDFTTPLNSNMTLVGKYVKTTLYTVKFNSDGGTSVSSQKVKPNEKVKEPEAITKYGFIFDGWYLNNSKFDFDTPITKNITLVAKWNEDETVKRYEVTFDSDGGSKVDKQRVIENEKAVAPKNPTKSGYTFTGWFLNDAQYDFKSKVTANITLVAKWEKIIQYTVTFNKDNGTQNETKVVNSGEKVKKPTDPTKTGYKFTGWLYDNQIFDFNTPITSDMTLTARYELVKTYTVTFDSNGGSSISPQTVEEGKTANRPNNPTKPDNDFVEWQLNGSKYDFNTKVNQDITLVAKWKAKTYEYTVVVTRVDNYSPDSRLTVKRNGTAISVKEIKYTDGVHLCDGSSLVVTTSDLDGETALLVVLNDDAGTTVRASIVR